MASGGIHMATPHGEPDDYLGPHEEIHHDVAHVETAVSDSDRYLGAHLRELPGEPEGHVRGQYAKRPSEPPG
jgi:hypothetical protein